MIIQSLCKYYDTLSNEDPVPIALHGFSKTGVSFALVISSEGILSNIIDLRSDEEKPQPQLMQVPFQKSRSVAIDPYFLCENAKYLFGVEKVKKEEYIKKSAYKKAEDDTPGPVVLEEDEKEVLLISERSRTCFESFKALHHSLLDSLDDSNAISILKYLDSWKPEQFLEIPKLREFKNEILKGGFFVIECDGDYLHRNKVLQHAWNRRLLAEIDNQENVVTQCLVCGQTLPVARLHQKIKGVMGAQPAGASLVSFNDQAFDSYGKKQSYNAPISESSMFKYTTALNHLLERNSRNKLQIGDATTVYWSETNDEICENLANFFFDSKEAIAGSEEQSNGEKRTVDKKTLQLVRDILEKVRAGQPVREQDIGINPEKTNFYVLGLSDNNARLAVRFWYQDSFGNFLNHIAQHYLDMEIAKGNFGPKYVSISRLLNATLPRKRGKKNVLKQSDKIGTESSNTRKNKIPPSLGGLLISAILHNRPYPPQMYSSILNRIKTGSSIDYVQLDSVHSGFIKAYLIRLARAGLSTLKEDLITVSLNKENPNIPYRLGRLFAVLESTQKYANPEIKRTIRDSYFASASSSPAVVYPILLKLSQHHLSKINSEKPGLGVIIGKSMDEIMSLINQFPLHLTLEEQGMFMLGYYHQHESHFKKDDGTKNTEEE